MRNPYEYPNEWEAGGEPDETAPASAPECRNPQCRSKEGPFNWFNGWPWCRETCYREISALYMGHFANGTPVTEADAEEHFRQRRAR